MHSGLACIGVGMMPLNRKAAATRYLVFCALSQLLAAHCIPGLQAFTHTRLQVWNSLPSFPPTTLPGQIPAILWVSQILLPMGSLLLNHVPNAFCVSTLQKAGIMSVLLTTASPTPTEESAQSAVKCFNGQMETEDCPNNIRPKIIAP